MNLSEAGFCFQHDTARADEVRAMRAAGGSASGKAKRDRRATLPAAGTVPKVPKTLDDAARYAAWLPDATVRGLIDARTSHEASVALREFRMAAEKRDLADEVARLRKELQDARLARRGKDE
jgi:hypothetical protein